MECKNRKGEIIKINTSQSGILSFFYNTAVGRCVLKPLVQPWVSKLGGKVLSTRLSSLAVPSFIKNNGIDMTEYEDRRYLSYNDFFTRRIKKDARLIDMTPNHLIAPCDSKLTVYGIKEDSRFFVKNTEYSLNDLLKDEQLAKRYSGGVLLLFRLSVDDYHHYCFIDNGIQSEPVRLKGVFHTVNPLANDVYPIYRENTREYNLLESEHFGTVLMMEVGALMVGKIRNTNRDAKIERGVEKGYFEFGGSTVILCLERDIVIVDDDIWQNSLDGIETAVNQGERIGKAV
ncbi:MAG: phosphatidylserine decarboxylase [Lachnospiraceae bacterium]|nr:phosphatidylserine decarboxylase [Lachnospiraceae bacterium]